MDDKRFEGWFNLAFYSAVILLCAANGYMLAAFICMGLCHLALLNPPNKKART